MPRLILPALPVLLALLPACVLAKVGDGESVTVESSFEGVSGFSLTTFIDTTVTVTPGAALATVSLTCDDSLLDDLDLGVRDGVLTLGDSASFALVARSDCHAEVDVPQLLSVENTGVGRLNVSVAGEGLDSITATGSGGVAVGPVATSALAITHTGSGPVSVDGLAAGSVDVQVSGSGRTSLVGAADSAEVLVTGSGGFGEAAFIVDTLVLTLTGSGGAELTVLESIDATVTGSGGATIHGDPAEREVQETGSGRVEFE